MNIDELLLSIEYLNTGLIPVDDTFYKGTDGDSLKYKLNTISVIDARKAKRKFRKVFKSAAKDKIEKIKSETKLKKMSKSYNRKTHEHWVIENFKISVGLNVTEGKKLSAAQSRNRRLLVHYFLREKAKLK